MLEPLGAHDAQEHFLEARGFDTLLDRPLGVARLALHGYQDKLMIGWIEPDSTWRGEFLADRPGEDFAWMLEGEPAGKLSVTGSHLVDGHR